MIIRLTLVIIFSFLVLSCSKDKKIVYEPSAKVDAFAIYEEGLKAFELNDLLANSSGVIFAFFLCNIVKKLKN